MAFILVLKKVWSFLKHYWYIPVIVIGLVVVLILTRKSPSSLMGILTKTIENHAKEVDQINSIHEQEIEKREKALEIYNKTVDQVREKYEQENKKISKQEKKLIETIVKDNVENPDKIAQMLADQFGFEVQK